MVQTAKPTKSVTTENLFFLLCRSLLRLVINPQLLAAQKTATNAPKPLGEHGFLIMPACKADPNAISSFEAQRYHERHYDFRCADQRTNFFHNGVVDPSLVILHISLPQISHKTQRMLRSFLQMDSSSSSIVGFSMVGIDASLHDPLGKF